MSLLSLPFPNFVNGTPADATQVDSNNAAIVAIINGNLDNANIGAAGIYASQLKPISTLTSTFTSPNGWTIGNTGTTFVTLLVNSPAAPSVDILQVSLNGTKEFWVDDVGAAHFLQQPVFAGAITATSAFLTSNSPLSLGTDGQAYSSQTFLSVFTANAGQRTAFFNGASAVLGIAGHLLGLATESTNLIAIDRSGNFAAAGSITTSQLLVTNLSGISVPATLSNGDGVVQRTASGGRFFIGGATKSGLIDYNLLNGSGISLQNESGYAPVFGGAYTNSSDAALKANIVSLATSTPKILALKPSSFIVLATQSPGLGFIAQDVAQVLPELVSTDEAGMMGVNYDGIIPVLVKAFQEMTATLKAAGITGF